jgi:urate oxidase
MPVVLAHHAYGKSQVRLSRVTRRADHDDLKELTIAVKLEGDFTTSYVEGDNRLVVATDSMKNIVYVMAKQHGLAGIESFGQLLADHFLKEYAQVTDVTITLVEEPWQRLVVDGREHPYAFAGGSNEKRTSLVKGKRGELRVEAGLEGLLLLKTTDSAFTGFVRDRYTTLPETDDRIFATALSASWLYRPVLVDWDSAYRTIRQALLDAFARHKSLAVQQTLHAMGSAALEACTQIEQITLHMPNKHRVPVNLGPFGLDNNNEVFVATDEPYGLISGTLRRE